uniref:nyctalopin-like n=1 Tax=Myxine glutinosa TaxID=7769 RepID=UPI00358EE8C0
MEFLDHVLISAHGHPYDPAGTRGPHQAVDEDLVGGQEFRCAKERLCTKEDAHLTFCTGSTDFDQRGVCGVSCAGVPTLLWLSLSHNNDLGTLHARALSGLQVLHTLILAACRLYDLPERLFAPTHGLTRLHLWHNRLRHIPGALRILSRLTHLYLEDNAIEVVASSSLIGLENLTLLDLQDNYISVIHKEAFISCNKLTSLNLANNHLSSLPPNAFNGLNQLQVLNLGGNQLLEVPQACLFGLPSLDTLHLERNRLKKLPPAVYDAMPLLHTLHLQGNRLSSLSPPNSISATALRTLYLFDNPWHCDCNLLWLLQSPSAHSQHPPYGAAARDVRCTSPEVIAGFLLPLLDFSGCFNIHENFTNVHKEPPNYISPARTLISAHDTFTGMVQRLLLERAKSVPEPTTDAPPNSVTGQSTHLGSIVLMLVLIWRL